MPEICRFICEECGFFAASGWGTSVYAVTAGGERVTCPHPGETWVAEKVTGLGWEEAMQLGRVGIFADCVCLECHSCLVLDWKRDCRRCEECGSLRVVRAVALVGQACPRCGVGTIKRLPTGLIA